MNVVGQDLYSESDLQDMSDEELEVRNEIKTLRKKGMCKYLYWIA